MDPYLKVLQVFMTVALVLPKQTYQWVTGALRTILLSTSPQINILKKNSEISKLRKFKILFSLAKYSPPRNE